MPKSYKIPKPDKLPEGDDCINFAHRRLCKLDEIIRNLNRKESSERTRIINDLIHRVIPKMRKDLRLARDESIKLGKIQEERSNDKKHLMELAAGSEAYGEAKEVYDTSCCILYSYKTVLPSKVHDYQNYMASCERVLKSYPQWHYDEEKDSHFLLTSHFEED
ncbi:hypothetical protein BOTCAL_0115g00010 [Botryotinia calthae]|uniref:Uncharacterized protein n=1 Tax=Botryotinia calthae TaxID=38488 RepID=A0A4Y8D4W3_9HELO|nr:hypothetical protein BOTCAL_0115g00010 [Botryotinia calthae]